jgi:glycosyltransferase involved in cell wall biosynthesis
MKNKVKNESSLRHEYDVSIVVLSYNHVNSIVAALTSVFAQEVDLRVELLISDDASTDQTVDRIAGLVPLLETKFSMAVILNSVNTGAAANFVHALKSAKGKYIAYLDGDDYWIDSQHVQKLYDACSGREQVAGVTSGHVKKRLSDWETIETCVSRECKSFQTLDNLEFYPLLGASMWKQEVIFSVPEELFPWLTDTLLWHFIAEYGECVALPYVSLAYNITGVGVHTSLSLTKQIEAHVDLYTRLCDWDTSDHLKDNLEFWLWWAMEDSVDRGDIRGVVRYSHMLSNVCRDRKPIYVKKYLKYRIISMMPLILVTYKKGRVALFRKEKSGRSIS